VTACGARRPGGKSNQDVTGGGIQKDVTGGGTRRGLPTPSKTALIIPSTPIGVPGRTRRPSCPAWNRDALVPQPGGSTAWAQPLALFAAAHQVAIWPPDRAFGMALALPQVVMARPEGSEHTPPTFVIEGAAALVEALLAA
jgi:hypothetical protein